MHIPVVTLNPETLEVTYYRFETITLDQELVLFDENDFVVPIGLNPCTVKGQRDGNGKVVIVEDPDKKYAWKEVRAKRDTLLVGSDWTQAKDVTLSPEKQALWAEYRQALRNITDVTIHPDPLNITWPIAPQ